ncbi:unnamed protein product [Rotaria socialis]
MSSPPINCPDSSPSTSIPPSELYHTSACGSILHSLPTKVPSEIFAYLQHGKLDAFRRSLDIYYKDIVQIKNENEQTVLHVLSIHVYPYSWVRLLIMFECDPCCQDRDGYTAAHYAVERDDIEMLKALTTRFHSNVKVFSDEQKIAIHERCLKALSLRQTQGLTVFMLACYNESIKCLDYLLELDINDAHLQDNFGDTCLHYAVCRRNRNLVTKLINQCHADVNDGVKERPSVLDISQFNRDQRKAFERSQDDSIEQILLSNNALSRCQLRRIVKKRKRSHDDTHAVLPTLTIRNGSTVTDSQIETARDYARIAFSLHSQRKLNDAKEYYKLAMNSISNDILDWADYALKLALIHKNLGENQSALDLLEQAFVVRKQFENETEDIAEIQRVIDSIKKLSLI